MTELSVQAVLRRRRQRRAEWLLTLGVALGLGLWAEQPTGPTTALVVVMASLTTLVVVLGRRVPLPALLPLLSSFTTVVVGGGLGSLGDPGSADTLVAVAVFALVTPAIGALGVHGGGLLAGAMVLVAAWRVGEADGGLLVALGGAVVVGWSIARHFHGQEAADLQERAEQAEVSWALARRAQTDALTRLPNRLSVQACLDEAFEATRRTGSVLSVLVVDVDHFKKVNDTHGHLVGDRALSAVARAIQGVLRHGDVAGRWGGEEFLVVLTSCGPPALEAIAERLRRAVEAIEVAADDGARVALTVSVGGASCTGADSSTPTDLIRQADQALYLAKREGRNRAILADALVHHRTP